MALRSSAARLPRVHLLALAALLFLAASPLRAQIPGDSVRVHRTCHAGPCGAPLEARYVGWRVDTLLVRTGDSTAVLPPGTVAAIDRWHRTPPGTWIALGIVSGAAVGAGSDLVFGDGQGGHTIHASHVAAGAALGLAVGLVDALLRPGRWERVHP